MMRSMVSPISQLDSLYAAMLKEIPSIPAEDAALAKDQDPSYPRESIREQVRQLNKAGLDYYHNGKLEEAAKCYEEALGLYPDSMLALYSFGVMTGQLERYEESKAAFERLLRVLEGRGNVVDPMLLATAHQ